VIVAAMITIYARDCHIDQQRCGEAAVGRAGLTAPR
jgi:hypothetical protein